MNYQRFLNEALEIHKELAQSIALEPEVVDLQLESRAKQMHDFFYTLAPWPWFHRYVREVHDVLSRPYWLFGRDGVDERLLKEIDKERELIKQASLL